MSVYSRLMPEIYTINLIRTSIRYNEKIENIYPEEQIKVLIDLLNKEISHLKSKEQIFPSYAIQKDILIKEHIRETLKYRLKD